MDKLWKHSKYVLNLKWKRQETISFKSIEMLTKTMEKKIRYES